MDAGSNAPGATIEGICPVARLTPAKECFCSGKAARYIAIHWRNLMNRHQKVLRHVVVAGAALVVAVTSASASETEPFKQTNIHFEINASACDMGIQISFD